MRALRSLPSAGALLLILALGAGCGRKPAPFEEPTPPAKPTPIYVPSRRMETSRLFNGMKVHSTVQADFGTRATEERDTPESYTLNLEVKVKVPRAHSSLETLSRLNPKLPQLLPGLATMLATGTTSEFFDDLYRRKVAALNYDLPRLNQLLSRHNFFDCETVLELQHPQTKRRALLIQADMDVVMDGSDGDRIVAMDGNSDNFQPMTSYKWPKATSHPNMFLAGREKRLKLLESELAGQGLSATRKQELRKLIPEVRNEIGDLKKNSFLIAAADPFVVVPGSFYSRKNDPYAPKLGDYCVVIHGDALYPAIVGDVGPSYKIGEASLRLSQQINRRATAYNRPVDELKATYLIFPGSADKPFAAPNLQKWRDRCRELLQEIGGAGGQLFVWEDITKPPPTPTPAPVSPLLAPPTPTPILPELQLGQPLSTSTMSMPSQSSTPQPAPSPCSN